MNKKKFIDQYLVEFKNKNYLRIFKYYSLPLVIIDKKSKRDQIVNIIRTKSQFKKYFKNLFLVLNKIYNYKKTEIVKIKKNNIEDSYITLNLKRINKNNKIFQKLKCTYFLVKKNKKLNITGFIVE